MGKDARKTLFRKLTQTVKKNGKAHMSKLVVENKLKLEATHAKKQKE